MINELLTWHDPLRDMGVINDRTHLTVDILYETGETVYPTRKNVFRAFRECEYDNCKVVMIFQDPYHNGQATGIATAVESGKIPITLGNIFKEISRDYGDVKTNPNLLSWCKQGVLLLNTALTVKAGSPGSHLKVWSQFTERFVTGVSKEKPLIWILLGREIQKYERFITGDSVVLKAPHPASEVYHGNKAGFFGSGIFKEANKHLSEKIVWHE